MQKRRIINNRPVCFFALALGAGIIIGEAQSASDPLMKFIPICVFAAAFIVFLCISRLRKFSYLFIAALIGVISISVTYDVYANNIRGLEGREVYQARVASEIIVEDGTTSFYADKIRANGKQFKGKVFVRIRAEIVPDFGAGDVIEIMGYISPEEHEPFDTYFPSSYSRKVYFYSSALSVRKLADGAPSFPLSFQLKIKRMLNENLDGYSASICQALLLGDKRGIDETMYTDIKTSGLAHVLAVSGLHITAVAGALYWLLKKLKCNRKLSFVIVTVLTFFYVMLCSFTPSALRAFIMTFVFAFAASFGFKRDDLSALGVAASAIVLFRPVALMDVGFLLSVFAMLGIFLFYKPFNKIGMRAVEKYSPKRHTGRRASEIAAVSLSSNLATYPLTAYFFNSVPVLFLISNIVILPYMIFIYIFLLVITAFSLITTLSGAVGIMYYLLLPFKFFIHAMGSVSFASVGVSMAVTGIVCYLLAITALSDRVFLSKPRKACVVLGICAICLALSAVVGLL